MSRLMLILLATLLLSACATTTAFYPTELGITTDQWNQYSDQQRQQAVEDYRQSQLEREKIIPPGSKLSVNIQGGSIYNSGNTQSLYQPVSFTINRGNCNQKITFFDAQDPRKKSKMYACYRGDTLYLDPASFDPENPFGSVKFQYLPNWKRGFTYPGINTTGSTKLTAANVTIQELSSSSVANKES